MPHNSDAELLKLIKKTWYTVHNYSKKLKFL